MILGEHKTAQFRPKMTVDAIGQRRRDHLAGRRQPALAAEIHHMRADHQILYDKMRIALEA